jgi:thiosulfate/3-mercaptopyruvate sulfurtransferase
VRWYLDPARRGRDAYAQGHLPGAVFLDVDQDLSDPGGGRGSARGRHPWPSADHLGRALGAAGVGPQDTVVAYDDFGGGIAARLWYLLRAHGHARAAVLDGGLTKWVAEGRALTTDVPTLQPTVYPATLRAGYVLTKDEVAALPRTALVLDVRAPERYRGEVEVVDPRAGHVPGARNAPFTENLTGDAAPVFRAPAELRKRYEALGADTVEPVVYCGSGVTACHGLLGLELAGLRGRLYAGSWSEWSADPSLPLETGQP